MRIETFMRLDSLNDVKEFVDRFKDVCDGKFQPLAETIEHSFGIVYDEGGNRKPIDSEFIPGAYLIYVAEEWDRWGDSKVSCIVRVPDAMEIPKSYMDKVERVLNERLRVTAAFDEAREALARGEATTMSDDDFCRYKQIEDIELPALGLSVW